jgi:hypothetical protein
LKYNKVAFEKYCNSMGHDINEIGVERVLRKIKQNT